MRWVCPRASHPEAAGSLVALALVASRAGHTSLTAIAQFGRLRGHTLGHALGFRDGKMPCANTFANLFAALDPDHLDRLIGDWLDDRHPHGQDHIALDGKVVRGSRDGGLPGVHLLSAYAPQASAVIAQMTVAATTNEHKAALRLLGVLPLGGAVVTADAMFTHPDVAQRLLDSGGDYVLYAKGNQTVLRADLEATFTAAGGGPFSPCSAGGVGGRRADGQLPEQGVRAGRAADAHHQHLAGGIPERLAGGGPGVPPGARANGEEGEDGRGVYGVTSLGRVIADAERLLRLSREHWGIENGLHDPPDETFREDRSRVRRLGEKKVGRERRTGRAGPRPQPGRVRHQDPGPLRRPGTPSS